MYHIATKMSARPTMPPTTPPAMAPAFDLEPSEEVDCNGVELLTEEVVETEIELLLIALLVVMVGDIAEIVD
jgi:hypothetical protein